LELFAGQLAVLPLFRGLTPLQLAAIARRADRVSYTPGATIIEENEPADAAILIVAGKAVRVSGPELVTHAEAVSPGSLLGEAAMLVETTYGSTVVARTQVRAVHILRETLHELILGDPGLADGLMQNLAGRLVQTAAVLRRADTLLARAEKLTGATAISDTPADDKEPEKLQAAG